MVSEAKRAYDNCTMVVAKKLANIYYESHEMRARLNQCVVVAST